MRSAGWKREFFSFSIGCFIILWHSEVQEQAAEQESWEVYLCIHKSRLAWESSSMATSWENTKRTQQCMQCYIPKHTPLFIVCIENYRYTFHYAILSSIFFPVLSFLSSQATRNLFFGHLLPRGRFVPPWIMISACEWLLKIPHGSPNWTLWEDQFLSPMEMVKGLVKKNLYILSSFEKSLCGWNRFIFLLRRSITFPDSNWENGWEEWDLFGRVFI